MSNMQGLLTLWDALTKSQDAEVAMQRLLCAMEHVVNQHIGHSPWSNRAIVTAVTAYIGTEPAVHHLGVGDADDVDYMILFRRFEHVLRRTHQARCWDVLLDVTYAFDSKKISWEMVDYFPESASDGVQVSASMERLLSSDRSQATHIFALPLRGKRRRHVGLIIFEARCRAAMGSTFVWAQCMDELAAMWHMAQPFICTQLPKQRVNTTLSNEQDVVEQMKVLADALVEQAYHAQAHGQLFDIDICNALRAYVLEAARQKTASLADVYRLFGRENLVTQRNHYRSYKREMKRKLEFEGMLSTY